MPFTANGQDYIIEGVAGTANANGAFRNVYYSSSLNLYGYVGATNYGYFTAGYPYITDIQRFPFALSITNATLVGNLYSDTYGAAGASSSTYGYVSGGYSPDYPSAEHIYRWPFAAAITDSSDVGSLAPPSEYYISGQSSSDYAYIEGADYPSQTGIQRFPFALSITNATNVGTMPRSVGNDAGQASSTYGYNVATGVGGPVTSAITRFPFALAITDAATVGDSSYYRSETAGQSSSDYGYTSGGVRFVNPTTFPRVNVIDRFPFALAITNAADVGDLTVSRSGMAGSSSSTYGYTGSGALVPLYSNVIDRFPFALAIANAADVGDLTSTRYLNTGQQY